MRQRASSNLNNQPLTDEQQAAFEASCRVISKERAGELLKLHKWKNGGCFTIRERPEIADVTPEEDAAIKSFWRTLPGWTSWMTSLELIYRDTRNEELAK